MASVTLSQVVKNYGSTKVVHGVDISINDGEFCVLVGPSGCGKSTLLRMVAGLEEISGGTVAIGERAVNELPPKERDVAMVFQSYALYPQRTVRDNMGFSLMLAKRPSAEIAERVNQAAEILGLTPYLDRLPKQLSGGQLDQRHLAVAVALLERGAERFERIATALHEQRHHQLGGTQHLVDQPLLERQLRSNPYC